jgi:hypothetical protein
MWTIRRLSLAAEILVRDGTPDADGDHHEQAHAKSGDGCGRDKGADAEGGADLPDLRRL